jgi:tryptophanyl-tRNA synthetase
MSVFNYPILMTSDIITYDTDIVPVWKDQIQHIEFARDIAGNFNKNYKTDLFKLPNHHVEKELQTIPWTDWRKMSKSYDNFIWIFDDEKILKKKIMSIITDTKWLEEPKDPETCNVFALIKLFANKAKQDEISAKYKAGNYWYWHAKLELLDIILEYFKDARVKYNSFESDMSYIEKKLEEWNMQANKMADEKYEKIMKIVWL